ncbi:MAG: cytochrome c biogenesis protein ResB [Anaerolineae bacterium]|nr:cytochrome c biogenesis protein ResB [Anaerolineae bacterium]
MKRHTSSASTHALRRVWHFLSRMDVASGLILLVLLLATFGSCFPQLTSPPTQMPSRWEAILRSRYGALTGALTAIGVFQFFVTPYFLLALALLIASTLLCTLHRWRGIWHQVFHQSVRHSAAVFHLAPLTAHLPAGETDAQIDALGRLLRTLGFHVRAERVEGTLYLRGDRNRWSPLGTLATHLAVLVLLVGAITSTLSGWRETVTIAQGQVVPLERHPDLAVRNEGFDIIRYPDGSPADYRAHIVVIHGGETTTQGIISVNKPLHYHGVNLLLHSYAAHGHGSEITLLAVHDPGYPLVIAGGILLLLGMTISFYLPHCRIYAQAQREGMLHIAAIPDRYVCDFGREFDDIVNELQKEAP